MKRPAKMPLAYSYLRFSSPQQAAGDSIRRQSIATADWCRRQGAQLDTSITLRDEGVSAFRGKHRDSPDLTALAGFLEAVKTGRVPRGSFLVVESLDRLSREAIRPALTLVLNLIESGIRVVQLMPEEVVYDDDVDPFRLMQAIMELARGHSESRVKSERVGSAWARKRKEAANRVVTRRLPGWIVYDEHKGNLRLDPDKAKIVRKVFALARAGKGVKVIAEELNRDGVPTIGRKAIQVRGKSRPIVWNETIVYHLLTSRATFGEFQPCRGRGSDRTPDGPAIPNYFPPVIDAGTFHAAGLAMKMRAKVGRGRRGSHVNLFSGLLVDARDGGSMTYKHLSSRAPSIIPVGAKQGHGSKWASFPAVPFEEAIVSELAEVTVADVRGQSAEVKKVEAIAGRLAEVDDLIRKWSVKMNDANIVDVVAAKLAELNAERKKLVEDLADAQREAASPLAETWSQFRKLSNLLKRDRSDNLRVKVRAALRRSIEGVYCLFTGWGRRRVAAVRVQFRGRDLHRDYLIVYDPGRSNDHVKRPGAWEVRSFAAAKLSALDLRKREHATELEAALREALGRPRSLA